MKSLSIVTAIVLAAIGAGLAAACLHRGGAVRAPRLQAAPLPVAPGTAPGEPVLTVAETAQPANERYRQLTLEIERALVAADPQQRETAFNVLLPELIQFEPARVVAMFARQQPGDARDALRDEVTRQWIRHDRDAAVDWMSSLDAADRRTSATIATRSLAAREPAQAIYVADQFGVGRDDGSLEHLVQVWATENMAEATRWIESQPSDDPKTAQLRTRIELVRTQQQVVAP